MTATDQPYPHVLRPLSIGPVEVRHRIMVTGHTQLYGQDGTLSERHIDYYRERALGGAALLVLEQQAGHPAGRNYHAGCDAFDERAIPWYERLGEAVHAHDCKQFVQLFACGAQGSGTQYIDDFRPLWAASRIPSAVTEEMPVAMEQADIDELITYFTRSARNVKSAGLDGIEIHAAHSQLLGEFLSPAFNHRTDRYGGSLRNRCQIVLELGESIREAIGHDLALGLRLSFDEFLGDAGITAEQTEEQIEIFSTSGLFDFFDISGGGYHALHIAVAPMGTVGEGFLADCAKRAKHITGDRAKIFVVGRFLDLNLADKTLQNGDADMIAMTRAHMADAHIINKSIAGNDRAVNRCIGANVCVARLIENREVTCVQNPEMGREGRWGKGTLIKLETTARKSIAVVGAGPAGLRFAGTAADRGHHIQLIERNDEVGGHLNLLKRLPSRSAWQGAIDNLMRRAEDRGVELITGTNATASLINGDEIVLATGAVWSRAGYSPYRPERLAVPGADLDHVLDIGAAINLAIDNPLALGEKVLVLDETGDYLPLGLAELLGNAGVAVEIVTPRPMVGADTQRTLDMPHVMPRLMKLGVEMTALHFVESISRDDVTIYHIWGGDPVRRTAVSTVVMAMTREPEDTLWRALDGDPRVKHRIGDVVAPRKLEAVIYEAEKLARTI